MYKLAGNFMMHDIVVDELETHLSGKGVYKNASRAFYAHLDACADCRAEVAGMDDLSSLLRELRHDAEATLPQPSLGFYNRVRYRIVEKQQKEAWGLFSPGAAFFRRIAFASLLLLAGLGSFLVTRESSFSGTDAASIMAQHDPVAAHSESSDRDRMLVTLATYRE
jgi:predicted anti-sigma-YlaC factor YlaD